MIGIVPNTTCLPFDFMLDRVMHWNEFIISDCSVKRVMIGVDCFMRCEYAVFNGRLVIESND